MILRAAGRVFDIPTDRVTHETFKRLRERASLESQLLDTRELVIKESANGTSRELRRLREKVKRLERRIEK